VNFVTPDHVHELLLTILEFLHGQKFIPVLFEVDIAFLVLPLPRLKALDFFLVLVTVIAWLPYQLVVYI
jgi:hypothetical protein